MRLFAGAFKRRFTIVQDRKGNPNSSPNAKQSPECLKLVTVTSVRLSLGVCLCVGVDNVHGNQRVMVHENCLPTQRC